MSCHDIDKSMCFATVLEASIYMYRKMSCSTILSVFTKQQSTIHVTLAPR